MKLAELKNEVKKYQYLEDEGLIDLCLAGMIATRLSIGRPVWMIAVGASSGGKSQLLRPLALTDSQFIHKIDDLTENTFLSGATAKDKELSLLARIGKCGIIVISDMTVLMSKAPESRATILSQFRMIYDGEMNKYSGVKDKPISWKGKLGILSGSTPSIYGIFEEVSDMGERFVFYRMKEYDKRKVMELYRERDLVMSESNVDEILAQIYGEYVKGVVLSEKKKERLPDWVYKRLEDAAIFAERVRASAKMEWRGKDIIKIPITAYPTRMFGQLVSLAYALQIMRQVEATDITEGDIRNLEWCAYSGANEEKRAVARIIAERSFDIPVRTQTIADRMGLSTEATNTILQIMAATGVLVRTGDSNGLAWQFERKEDREIVRRIEGIVDVNVTAERDLSVEESAQAALGTDLEFERI